MQRDKPSTSPAIYPARQECPWWALTHNRRNWLFWGSDRGGRVAALGDLARPDLLVEGQDGVEKGLGRRGAARGVDVDGDDLVDALDDGVIVEHAAGRGADAHGDDPLGFHHLVVDLTEDGGHLLRDTPRHDHEVGLAGRGPEDLHAETGDVVVGGADGHHLDGAAGEAEGHGPDRIAA